MIQRDGLTGGELLALGDEHKRGLHVDAVADCTRCLLEQLRGSSDGSVHADLQANSDGSQSDLFDR